MNANPEPRERELLRIGAVARASGHAVESLRFYEARGLIAPVGRTPSGYRLYGKAVLERLAFIRKAQSAGFTLDEIAKIVAIADAGKKPCHEVRRLAEAKLADLDNKLADMRQLRDRLRQVVERWRSVGEADGEICGLIESLANGEEE